MATMTLDYYDAGLLGDGGGGDVSWWQDYIRSELERAHEFYQSQIDAHLREREAAKAGVTDEMAFVFFRDIYGSETYPSVKTVEAFRLALEAVAPTLASARVPDMVCEQHPWSEWPHEDCAGPGMPGAAQYDALAYLAKRASARVPDIDAMVRQFLNWRLPENFSPDCGISFTPEYNVEYMAKQGKPPMRHEPTGTNLFDADQARAMILHMLAAAPKRGEG